MKPKVLVIIPTFNHEELLNYSVASVLSQTYKNFEIFIIGDGAGEKTRRIVEKLRRRDKRIIFFDHPKGERHGEIYRHMALKKAKGDIISYLADDDLWLPNHLETVVNEISGYDFVNTLPIKINTDGNPRTWKVDLGESSFVKLHLAGTNRLPICFVSHTMKFYRRLPYGWRTAPKNIPTDLYMWKQCLKQRDVRLKSINKVTAFHFPTPQRTSWTNKERVRELEKWSNKIRSRKFMQEIVDIVFDEVARDRAKLDIKLRENILILEVRRIANQMADLPLVGAGIRKVAQVIS